MLKTLNLKNGLKIASYQIPQMHSVFVNFGGDLEYADETTLTRALEGRQEY